MNTTKKDVQDEKLYFIQSFDAMPKMDQMVRNRKMFEGTYECSATSFFSISNIYKKATFQYFSFYLNKLSAYG